MLVGLLVFLAQVQQRVGSKTAAALVGGWLQQ